MQGLIIIECLSLFILGAWFLYNRFRKKYSHRILIGSLLIFLGGSYGIYNVSLNLPLMTEQISITALNEQSEGKKGSEIFITGYKIDDKQYPPFVPSKGKWFWIGNQYCWRAESDSRQPEGTTRTIVVDIPAGRERFVTFSSNEWRGKVQIDTQTDSVIIDTSITSSFDIGKSPTTLLWKMTIIYMLSILGGFLIWLLILKNFLEKSSPQKLSKWFSQYKHQLVYLSLALASLFFTTALGAGDSFWYDEVYQIGFSGFSSNIIDTIKYSATLEESSPFLFGVVANLWYRIVPYGEEWLLLLPRLACSGSVFLIGNIGNTIRNRRTGIMAALIATFSPVFLYEVSSDFRAYGFLILFASLMIWMYVCRQASPGHVSMKSVVLFGVSMVFIAYTHYFGILLCVAFFFADLYGLIIKKIDKKAVVSYLIAGVAYIPWILIIFINKNSISSTWHRLPTLKDIYTLIQFLCGNELILFFFFLGTAIIVYQFIRAKGEMRPETSFLWCVLFIVFGLFVYGKIKSDFTLWAPRYFVELVPLVILICAFGIDMLCLLFMEKKQVQSVLCITIGLLLCYYTGKGMSASNLPREPYRQAADWLYTQGNYVYNDDTLVICTNWPEPVITGWNEYYITRQGQRDPINVVGQRQISLDKVPAYNRIYLFSPHNSKAKEDLAVLLSTDYKQVDSRPNEKIIVYEKVVQ